MSWKESRKKLGQAAGDFLKAGENFVKESGREISKKTAPQAKRLKENAKQSGKRIKDGLDRFLDKRD